MMLRIINCRVIRRYIYFFASLIVLVIQLVLAISLYSSLSWELTREKRDNIKDETYLHHFENNLSQENSIDINNNNLNVNIYKANNLKDVNNFINLKFPCNITSKYAISSINRASSHTCKQQLANIACLSESKSLYPRKLPNHCHLKDGIFGDYMGCYRDDYKSRVLSGHFVKLANNSPHKCLTICLQLGYSYSGVEYRNECFCGKNMPLESAKISYANCDMHCPGSISEMCGGYYTINVYKTGVSKVPKIIPNPSSYANGKNPVRIAFLLTVNGRAFQQIRRLIKNIYHIRHFYYIHVDADYLFRELLKLEEEFPNIKLSRRRMSTIWGGASLLQILLHCILDLLRHPQWGNAWDYVINLSESDFPIKPLNELENFLTANNGKNFVKSHGHDTHRFISKQGLDKTFYECDTHMWRISDRELPIGIKLDGGSDWVALNRHFCHYISFSDDQLIKGLKEVFKYTLLPAESFFHTILHNSAYCDTIIDNNLRITNWRRKQGCKCQYKHIVDWCGCSPNDFKLEDWNRIVSTHSKPYYFARKFEPVISNTIINHIEEWINEESNGYDKPILSEKYWQNDYHYKDKSPQIDDAKFTLYYSIAILSFNKIKNMCLQKASQIHGDDNHFMNISAFSLSHVQESHLFFQSDTFKGILISYEVINGQKETENFEIDVRPFDHFVVYNNSTKFMGKLLDLKVCSDYDVKEQIFRNFGCILGPFSKVIALHKWLPNIKSFTVTFSYIDPINIIIGSYNIKIESNSTDGTTPLQLTHTPNFTNPLRPGIWRLLILINGQIMAETKFLIIPLYFYNGKVISKSEAKVLHNPQKSYRNTTFYDDKNYANKRTVLKNSRKIGKELMKYIHDLSSQFWNIYNICIFSHSLCRASPINLCRSTDWSSFSQNPKSITSQ